MATSDAKRAAKKHEKEKKRQKKLAARPPRVVKKDPVDAWRPAVEGIEGLAHRLEVGSHDAAHLAELVATHGRRADAKNTWLPGKVRALTTEQILAELGKRGVVTDEATFVAAAEAREGARDLAIELWKPMMRPNASPHDRDFVGEAAVALWERWTPHRVSDEVLHDLLRIAFDHVEDGATDLAFDAMSAAWERARDCGGLDRLARADGRGEGFLEQLLAFHDELGSAASPEVRERALATLREVRESLPPGDESYVHAVVVEARTLEGLGRPEEAIELLLTVAPAWPLDPDVLGESVEIFTANAQVSRAHGERVRDALAAARDAAPDPQRPSGAADVYQGDLDRIEEALATR